MAIAAIPDYLRKHDLSTASPGLRFGMYLPLWGEDARTRLPLWTTRDLNERVAGRQGEMRSFKDENKGAALRQALTLNPGDVMLMRQLHQRQSALVAPLAETGQLLTVEARAVAPFTTGLGNEHPLENGFAFLNPYGLPYLAGSGAKGVLRQAARELVGGDWGDAQGWDDAAITALFGKDSTDGDTELQRGALSCWDVIPQLAGDTLRAEVMTPHQTHYYQNGQTPHDSGQPVPIVFVTVPPGSRFTFHLYCDPPHKATEAIYKMESLLKLGGLRTREMIIDYRGALAALPANRKRAELSHIEFVSGRDLRDLKGRLGRWLARQPSPPAA